MVFGLVMLDMDAHMFMLTSLDFLGLNMMVLDVNNRQTKHVFCFSHQLQGGFVTCPLNQSNEVFVCVLKIPKFVG